MPSALSTYGFLSAKLKARISKILPADKIDTLIKSRSLPEAMQLLRGTAYEALESAYAATGDLRAAEAQLEADELELYTELVRHMKEPLSSFVEAMSLRFEIDKVKNAVRIWFDATIRGRDISGAAGYLYRPRIVNAFDVDAVVMAPDIGAACAAFNGTPYAVLLRDASVRITSDRSLFSFEIALDRYYYDQLFLAVSRLPKRDRAVAERVLGVDVDIHNIAWLARLKGFYEMPVEKAISFLIPRGRTINATAVSAAYAEGGALDTGLLLKNYGQFGALIGRAGEGASKLALMESALRQVSLSEAGRNLAGYPFSVGVVLSYFVLKAEEMRTVMTILNAKYYSLPEERIRGAL